jgi:enoyl-CoA hydratase/carnithine racemase
MDMLEKFDASMAGVYADRSGMDRKKIAAYMDKETFFNGEEAVELGLADDILPADKVKPAEETPEARADRVVDTILAKQNLPRNERRALLSRLKDGTPGAAVTVTPCAGETPVLQALQDLTKTLKASTSNAD